MFGSFCAVSSCLILISLLIIGLGKANNDRKPKSVVVEIPSWGKVEGYKDKLDGKNISVYLGIPYAQPPVGKLRFSGK